MTIAVATDDFKRFVYFRIDNGSMREREEVTVAPGGPSAVARQFVGLEIDLLIADRLPEEMKHELFDAGVKLILGVSGRADATVAAYLDGSLNF